MIAGLFLVITDDWNKVSHPFKKLEFGKWEITLPANPDGSCPIKHMSRVKVSHVRIMQMWDNMKL